MGYLIKFKPGEIKISRDEAKQVLMFFFGQSSPGTKNINLTESDVAFAQALLTEAIDASTGMSYVQTLFETQSSLSIKSLIFNYAKAAAAQWFRNKNIKNDPRVYESVRVTLGRNFKSLWQLRLDGGDLLY
jgi:hypothetical protein